jgi:recombinational DNA repair ATPase RecF
MNDHGADEHVKDVYAQFGLAVYLAQVLEHGLASALVSAELIPRRAFKPVPKEQWETEFSAFLDLQFQQTLGRLIRSLKKATTVPDDLEILLTEALERRNFLTHHFFRKRAEVFMSHEGRQQMIAELQGAQELFEYADERLCAVERTLREKCGLSDKKLKPYIDEYFKKHSHDL